MQTAPFPNKAILYLVRKPQSLARNHKTARGVEGAKWRSPADTENDYPDDGLKRAAHIIRSAMPD
jgi:hypothetical protein